MIYKHDKKVDKEVLIIGLLCITAIEIFALSKGMNGVLMSATIGIIAGMVGVFIPKEKMIREREPPF